MPSFHPFRLPELVRTARGAAAVLAVAAFVTALLVSGRPGGQRALAAEHPPAPLDDQSAAVLSLPDVSAALGVIGPVAEPPRATRSHARAPLHRWVRPFWGVLTSPFGMRWGRLHAGIDLAGPYGSTIVAATDGCISYAGPMSGYGEVMQIADWDGTETVYGHMSSFLKRTGCVRAGQPIARVGAAGDATGPHLHFEVRVGGAPINPIPFLAKRGLVI